MKNRSLKTVVQKRPKCRKLTFCIPFDLPDAPGNNEKKSARQKYENARQRWREQIPGADQVRIELWSGGDLLERLVNSPARRGISWFFWDDEVFSPEWCAKRQAIAISAAGERYSPELHVELPVAFALDGLALTGQFWERYRACRNRVLSASRETDISSYTGLGVTRKLQTLVRHLKEWQLNVPSNVELPDLIDWNVLLKLTNACLDSAYGAMPYDIPSRKKRAESQRSIHNDNSQKQLQAGLYRLIHPLEEFESFVKCSATKAACYGVLLLTGEAGQGKTHLFCDASKRAFEIGQPSVVLFGGRMSGRDVWSEVAKQLGLEHVGSEYLTGAMQAAAEASNAPFLLLIDAMNEAADPRAWQEELPALLAEVDQNPWISVGVSVRSSYRRIVLPNSGLTDVAEIEHTGFREREIEATERFFRTFGLEQPRIPLLEREFTNPLFLKLYCQSLKGLGLSAPMAGSAHMSEVFEWYLKYKEERIVSRLRLDPASRPVVSAIDAFSEALANENLEYLDYERCEQVINKIAPHLHEWPNTLFGQLLSEDVLTRDATWEGKEVVRFTYQRFADYKVFSTFLVSLDRDQNRLRHVLKPGSPLRNRILSAPPGRIEALSVQLPEQFNIELLDAARWKLKPHKRCQWNEAFVRSISTRRPSAVSKRTRELLQHIQRHSGLNIHVLETLLTVAPQPEHPLNANALHNNLQKLPMPKRDVTWSIPTYFEFNSGSALDRLIRWSGRGPYPEYPDEVIELAAIPLIWTFTSPNRRMRDYVTKCLSSLLSERLSVLSSLILKFDGCNDPYVIERLAVVSHGAVLCGGSSNPKAAVTIAEELTKVASAETQIPNIITRDAVRGVYEWCMQQGLIDDAQYAFVLPTYGSAPPKNTRTEIELKREYHNRTHNGVKAVWPYARLFDSVFTDDFGCYVIDSKLRNFSRIRLSSVRRSHGVEEWYPAMKARCWIFERVLSLGWKPELFHEFDSERVGHWAGRGAHKIERFGKKYQWIAFREFTARVADNFQMTDGGDYQGPWQFFGRDIDPTLPPPPIERVEDDSIRLKTTFPQTKVALWSPPGPRYHRNDPTAGDDWGTLKDDIPKFEELVRSKDDEGIRWVVLRAHFDWDERPSEGEHWWSRRRRSFWSQVYSWLVHPTDQPKLVKYLQCHSLIGQWMPEGLENTDAAYLGELPWAETATFDEQSGYISWPDNPISLSHEVHPAWTGYLWEGNVLDCSINHSVDAWLPTPILYNKAKLTWRPGTREWFSPDRKPVAHCCENDHHTALLREDWLKRILRETGRFLVWGWIGDKQLIEAGISSGLVGDYTRINATASLVGSNWTFEDRRIEQRSVQR